MAERRLGKTKLARKGARERNSPVHSEVWARISSCPTHSSVTSTLNFRGSSPFLLKVQRLTPGPQSTVFTVPTLLWRLTQVPKPDNSARRLSLVTSAQGNHLLSKLLGPPSSIKLIRHACHVDFTLLGHYSCVWVLTHQPHDRILEDENFWVPYNSRHGALHIVNILNIY